MFQSIKNLNQEWKELNRNTVTLTQDIFIDKYLVLPSCLIDNLSLWPITLCTVYFNALTSEVGYQMVSEQFIIPQLQLLTSKETKLNPLQLFREVQNTTREFQDRGNN